jgi:pimeloyl-ACP methyl ester carboxylesterase
MAAALSGQQGGPVDVAGHRIGATCVLGAAALGAPFRRIALYEPPGPQTTQNNWPERVTTMVADGHYGRAASTFLTEIIGLTRGEVEALRDAPGGRDVLPIVATTFPREAHALAAANLPAAARQVRQPVLLLLGTASPPWASQITRELAAALPAANRDRTSRHRARDPLQGAGPAGGGGIALPRGPGTRKLTGPTDRRPG